MIMQSTEQVDNNVEIDKYINDYRLLDIRCGVLEDEKQDFSKQMHTTKSKIKSIEQTLTTL